MKNESFLVIHPDTRGSYWVLLTGIIVVILAGFGWLISPSVGALVILGIGIMIVTLGMSRLMNKSHFIRLTQEGLEISEEGRVIFYSWSQVSNFRSGDLMESRNKKEVITFNVEEEAQQLDENTRSKNRKLGKADEILRKKYSMKKEKLVLELRKWQERFASGAQLILQEEEEDEAHF